MKHSPAGLFLACLLAACASKPVQTEERSAPLSATSMQTAPTAAAPQPPAPVLTEAAPAVQENKQECAGETAPAETNALAEESPQQAAPEAQPAAKEETPAERIALARQKQTLPAPAPDTPSFSEEETIPLEGRRLSPFAYEPVLAAQQNAPWAGEELKYGLYYSFIKAGTAYIKTRGISEINGRTAYVIQTTAFSASVIDPFFKVRDINYSWLDAENFYSLGYSQSVREGNYKRDEWLAFDYEKNAYYGEVQKKSDPRVISGELNTPVLDMLTALYFVRAQELSPGKDIVFDIVNREKQYPLIVKVLKKETVKTAAGKFNCVVVEPQFRGEGIFVSKGKSLQVWLTDDAYKMPVKMKTEVFIGSVSAELLEYKRN